MVTWGHIALMGVQLPASHMPRSWVRHAFPLASQYWPLIIHLIMTYSFTHRKRLSETWLSLASSSHLLVMISAQWLMEDFGWAVSLEKFLGIGKWSTSYLKQKYSLNKLFIILIFNILFVFENLWGDIYCYFLLPEWFINIIYNI